ncbi:MAG: GNAT family N-acetyltransferase [Pelagibacteraceae bacterium]|jgi:ribosomal protein S18 acetylase RimI-like enzyme|nr:GNAT family N-acetyltransferase [Pelagibacteraceae bacterium]MBT3901382.1 GNAT family N-acetyltransferase [Pelagibacteraceae bacterium]MBT4951133.1 GNAT family N-acetyltransferase [Pelagibacteraceae bacterium]MBT5213939.1 GNAT family N-acetyltransferase [Pelagibacteraceae bacterium]MBT6198428.1 GNAT family N-acetyltransferase [Pelagibacteraceae bacterium]
MKNLTKENMNIAVDNITVISDIDEADLCSITEQAIKAGGGFGWLTIPTIDTLKKYWNGIVLIKTNILIVGRLNGTIAGALQISFNPPNNEAQKNIAKIQSQFVAPWARGYGLAKSMIDLAIKISKENNKSSIQLDIRETQSAAIQLFESKGFSKWGENPSYAFINGNRVKGYYYYKDL